MLGEAAVDRMGEDCPYPDGEHGAFGVVVAEVSREDVVLPDDSLEQIVGGMRRSRGSELASSAPIILFPDSHERLDAHHSRLNRLDDTVGRLVHAVERLEQQASPLVSVRAGELLQPAPGGGVEAVAEGNLRGRLEAHANRGHEVRIRTDRPSGGFRVEVYKVTETGGRGATLERLGAEFDESVVGALALLDRLLS